MAMGLCSAGWHALKKESAFASAEGGGGGAPGFVLEGGEKRYEVFEGFIRVGAVRKVIHNEDAAAGLARGIGEGVWRVAVSHFQQIHQTFRALAGEGVHIYFPSEGIQAGQVVLQQQSI